MMTLPKVIEMHGAGNTDCGFKWCMDVWAIHLGTGLDDPCGPLPTQNIL